MGKRVVVCVVVAVALVVLVGCGRPASGYLAQRGAEPTWPTASRAGSATDSRHTSG